MLTTHRPGRRLAVLTTVCATLALIAAANVSAYPVTPEGEPLYPDPVTAPATEATSTPVAPNAIPIREDDPSGWMERGTVTSVAAVAVLIALAALAAALVVSGQRRRSAKAH